MLTTYKKHIIKQEFIGLIKDYPAFPFGDRDKQQEVADQLLEQVFERTSIYVHPQEKKDLLQELMESVVFGLRQIQRLTDDPTIEEIMINGMQDVFIKRRFAASAEKTDIFFQSKAEVRSIVEKLLEGTGRRVDKSTPMVDTRLSDGTRVNIIMSPLTLEDISITIRKFPSMAVTPQNLLDWGTIDKALYDFLKLCVKARQTIVISGGTASGKTTLLNALTSFVEGGDSGDRIVVIEEIAEIKLPQKNKKQSPT